MSNKVKLDILKSAYNSLMTENWTGEHNKHEYLCNAIKYSAVGKLSPQTYQLSRELAKEVTDMIGGCGTLASYLRSLFGTEDSYFPMSVTQPIRFAMLERLTAKYEKLVAADE